MDPRFEGGRRRVAVVTGGGGGIGAAIAEVLGRLGTHVITMDPLVSVDGTESIDGGEPTTADRIVAAGGSARASATSVTDRDAVHRLFAGLADEFGGLDVVVNVAGITRPTGFARGRDEDWYQVLAVHLDGYRNVLDAALPLMAAAGHGHILGITSGSGWRAADAGAYSGAKRAVASLTWELGRHAPPGVVINALSPIALTRMVTAAMARRSSSTPTSNSAQPSASPLASRSMVSADRASTAEVVTRSARSSVPSATSSTGGLSLSSMPAPEQLGPLAAHLVAPGFVACRGQVLFAAGTETAVIAAPRLIEVFGIGEVGPLPVALEAITPGALVAAEAAQASAGGSNPRFAPPPPGPPDAALPPPVVAWCALVADPSELTEAVVAALAARGVTCRRVVLDDDFDLDVERTVDVLDAVGGADRGPEAIVVVRAGCAPGGEGAAWEQILATHRDIVEQIHGDAAWARGAADLAARTGRPVRLVTLTDATTAGGRSRAQAAAQLARAARGATDGRVTAFAVGVESVDPAPARAAGELAAHLVCSPATVPLAGAELVVGAGSIGLRSHPRVEASFVIGDGEIPGWFDAELAEVTGSGASR